MPNLLLGDKLDGSNNIEMGQCYVPTNSLTLPEEYNSTPNDWRVKYFSSLAILSGVDANICNKQFNNNTISQVNSIEDNELDGSDLEAAGILAHLSKSPSEIIPNKQTVPKTEQNNSASSKTILGKRKATPQFTKYTGEDKKLNTNNRNIKAVAKAGDQKKRKERQENVNPNKAETAIAKIMKQAETMKVVETAKVVETVKVAKTATVVDTTKAQASKVVEIVKEKAAKVVETAKVITAALVKKVAKLVKSTKVEKVANVEGEKMKEVEQVERVAKKAKTVATISSTDNNNKRHTRSMANTSIQPTTTQPTKSKSTPSTQTPAPTPKPTATSPKPVQYTHKNNATKRSFRRVFSPVVVLPR